MVLTISIEVRRGTAICSDESGLRIPLAVSGTWAPAKITGPGQGKGSEGIERRERELVEDALEALKPRYQQTAASSFPNDR